MAVIGLNSSLALAKQTFYYLNHASSLGQIKERLSYWYRPLGVELCHRELTAQQSHKCTKCLYQTRK